MAKIERYLRGNLDEVMSDIQRHILDGSLSASLEDSSFFVTKNVRCTVKVFERYSFLGSHRVSLTVTLLQEKGGLIYASAITSGGSCGVFIKLDTFGEESFLDCVEKVFNEWATPEKPHDWE